MMEKGGGKMSNKRVNHKKRNPFLILLAIKTILLLVFIGIYYFLFSQQNLVNYSIQENTVIFQGELYENNAFLQNEQLYLAFSFISEHIDSGITFDEQSESVIIISDENILRFPKDRLEKYVNEEIIEIEVETFISDNQQLYVEIEQLENIYPLQYNYYPELKSLSIFKNGEEKFVGTLKTNVRPSQLRLNKTINHFSDYYDELEPGEQLLIEKEKADFYYVRKSDGRSGYVKKSLFDRTTIDEVIVERNPAFRTIQYPLLPINLTWEAVYSNNPDVDKLPKMPGVNVVSPTWFKIKNEDGDIHSLGQMKYVHWAKERGYQIWGLFSNDFNPDLTSVVLQNYDTRQKMIRQLLQYSEMYKLDGINVDFENVYLKDKDLVTQFVRELTAMAHQAGLIVSMDITFISTSEMWSMFYDREALAEIVDYMVVMAYDEHWGSSPVAGSVASFPWVEQNLRRLLEIIPNDQLILGIPTYTRLWMETETEGGNIEVSSRALSMNAVEEWISERNLIPVYDEVSGQDYVEYYSEAEKTTYKIWIENAASIRKRGQMVHDFQLAGVASWNRFFTNNESWEALNEVLTKEQ